MYKHAVVRKQAHMSPERGNEWGSGKPGEFIGSAVMLAYLMQT